jgi:hypothetical protein
MNIGGMSGEGNEAGNRVFRHIRENMAFRGSTMGALRDVLRVHWLYSSPRLVARGTVRRKANACSTCFEEGHKKTTCPIRKK